MCLRVCLSSRGELLPTLSFIVLEGLLLRLLSLESDLLLELLCFLVSNTSLLGDFKLDSSIYFCLCRSRGLLNCGGYSGGGRGRGVRGPLADQGCNIWGCRRSADEAWNHRLGCSGYRKVDCPGGPEEVTGG